MKVEFYFDPICPFCWVTSRWLLMVQPQRGIDIEWKPFSLALKNKELKDLNKNDKNAVEHRSSHRVLRVIQRATLQHGASLIDLYTAFGIGFHISGKPYDNKMIESVLKQKDLPLSLLEYADDEKIDDSLENIIKEATEVVGNDIGVPTIIYNKKGAKTGFFGPVLQELPDKDEALKLWDSLLVLTSTNSFYELKRNRPSDSPDVFSTAKC